MLCPPGCRDAGRETLLSTANPSASSYISGALLTFTGPYPTTFSGNTAAMVVSHTAFSGGVTNAGTIGAGGISVSSSTFLSGGIVDTGFISGGIRIDSHSKVLASGGTGIALENTVTFGGGISNAGTISAGSHGVFISAVSAFAGGINNSGTVSARAAEGVYVDGPASSPAR